jgi:hypothetical protein
MKTKAFQLKIDKPCTQNWNAMSFTEGGRYCSSCAKTVTDFSKMNNEEIGDYFKTIYTAAAQSGQAISICGHIKKSQLVTTFTFSYKTPFNFNTAFVRLSLAGILTFSSLKSFAQSTQKGALKIVLDDSGKNKKNKVTPTASANKAKPVQLKIKVINAENKKALANATIQVEGILKKFKADKNGYALINLPDSLGGKTVSINISFPGFENQFINVDLKTQNATTVTIDLYHRNDMIKGGIRFVPVEKETKL